MSPAPDLWSFARDFYAEPGVAEAFLALQDGAGADVCLVLHLLHLATARRSVTVSAVAEIDAAARPWRESVVIPLRMIRRGLRQSPAGYAEAEPLRRSVAAIEIEAERMQLAFLEMVVVTAQQAATSLAAAQDSLSAYCALLGRPHERIANLLALFDGYHSAYGQTEAGPVACRDASGEGRQPAG